MAKSLNDVLKRYTDAISGKLPASSISALTTGDNPGVDYADKMKDTRDFLAMHTVEKHADRNGNGDDVFKASKVNKAKMERHGHEPKPKDIMVYDKTQQIGDPENKLKEEAENDDGWYTHREIHGSKAVSKEEWKKGWRLNSRGKKVKKTSGIKEAEELDEIKKPLASYIKKRSEEMKDWGDEDSIRRYNKAGYTVGDQSGKELKRISKKYIAKAKSKLGEESVFEAKDDREYDYEGEMAVTKLKTIIRAAEHLIKMMEPNTNLPEWVQNKIIKAEDYITTAHDYLMSEMNEEVEGLDETSPSNKPKKNRAAQKVGLVAAKAGHPDFNKKIRADVAVKRLGRQIQKEEVEALDEAKCNMTEAGKMCEVHGMKACPKEEKKPSDEQPMYNDKNKKKKGKQLILDKDIQEREMTAAEKKKEESLKDKYDDSDMKEKMMKQYGAEKGKQVYFAYIRKKAMSESISDQRSSKKTSSENAREKIYNAMERRKERKEKEKQKMKEQAAPTETPITLPVYSSTHGFDRI